MKEIKKEAKKNARLYKESKGDGNSPRDSKLMESLVARNKELIKLSHVKKQEKDEFANLGKKILSKVLDKDEDVSSELLDNFAKKLSRNLGNLVLSF